jgi:uncharacterized protein (TIGR02145 family)
MDRYKNICKGLILILIISTAGIISSCEKETEPENIAPSVQITSPNNGDLIEFGDTVLISANASDPDGSVRDVQFYLNGVKDTTLYTTPYTYEWFTIEDNTGSYEITAIAVDNNGADDVDKITISLNEIGTVTDYDGNIYKWSRIGDQKWMIENLKSTHYADGTEIPLVESAFGWDNLSDSDKGYCYFENTSSNNDVYGSLYNWAAVMNGENSSDSIPSEVQGVCPTGWHLPSDSEWQELELYLEMELEEVDNIGWRGFNQGGMLKETGDEHWDSPNTGATNTVGFTALPSGYRVYYGTFNELGFGAYYWSATEFNSTYSWQRYLHADSKSVGRKMELKNSGFSVRCVED